jgi:NADPH:quinone reductase-like Zn-dependent oxidoreductase
MRLGSLWASQKVTFFLAKIDREGLELLRELLETGSLRSVVDRRYELSEIADALGYLGEGHARGKIVVAL